jgi:hypothetical protein
MKTLGQLHVFCVAKLVMVVLFDSFDILILTINLWRNPWVYLVVE